MNYFVGPASGQAQQYRLMEHATNRAIETHSTPDIWQVGQVVSLCEPIATNPAGCVGLVYQLDMDDPQTPYVAIILETGDDLNLFEAAHVHDSFVALIWEHISYEFSTPAALMADFKRGLFTEHFAKGHQISCGDKNG